MPYAAWIVALLKFSLVGRMIRWAGGGLLGLAVLGWVVDRAGYSDVEVVIQVVEPDVEVAVGGQTFAIRGQRDAPIVCELPPGWHRLVMRRGDRVLFEEDFEVRPGKNVVRTAYDPERVGDGPGPGR